METSPVCHAFLTDAKFYDLLYRLDEALAEEARAAGCAVCGGVLHRADYPRKPRGIRSALDERYERRLSWCCMAEGCRRRTTPPSVRFLGRKVYLGAIVVLATASQHGLTAKRRSWLIETLGIPAQTLSRWRRWWREAFPASRCFRALRGQLMAPLAADELPGALLGRLTGGELSSRLCQLLLRVSPVTTSASA
jgi:hypothetical protein